MFLLLQHARCRSRHKLLSAVLLFAAASVSMAQTSPAGGRDAKSPSSFTITVATPSTPILSGTVPSSPSTDATPTVVGSADPNTPISIYKSSFCAGTAVATGTSDGFGTFAIPVSVALHTTTTFTARAGTG